MNAKQWYQREYMGIEHLLCSEMESTLSKPLPNSSISPFLFRLHRHFSTIPPTHHHYPLGQLLTRRLRCAGSSKYGAKHLPGANAFGSVPFKSLRTLSAVVPPVRLHVQCVSSSAASFASGGGDGEGRGGGGGDGNGEGGDGQAKAAAGAEEAAAMGSDVIILDVGGMSCGGCASSVKKILESLVFGVNEEAKLAVGAVEVIRKKKQPPNDVAEKEIYEEGRNDAVGKAFNEKEWNGTVSSIQSSSTRSFTSKAAQQRPTNSNASSMDPSFTEGTTRRDDGLRRSSRACHAPAALKDYIT